MPYTEEEEEKYAAEVTGNANPSLTYPAQASSLRKGGYALLKSHPCKILEIHTSKPGKHGHAKCAFSGIDIFTGKFVEDSCPSSHNMEVPFVKKREYEVVYVTADGFLALLEGAGMKEDVKLPETSVGEKVRSMVEHGEVCLVIIISAMGKEVVVDAKASAKD
ncbi:eukaryotic translation initiation factor eIF-5A [Bisporella sp. PMI_857]|nr:eukaryotic translation initiation factor eIF-5A [Bisporella sp. PMI_857]